MMTQRGVSDADWRRVFSLGLKLQAGDVTGHLDGGRGAAALRATARGAVPKGTPRGLLRLEIL